MNYESNDNHTTKPIPNEEILHNFRMKNDPDYAIAYTRAQVLRAEDPPLEDVSLDVIPVGLAARAAAPVAVAAAKRTAKVVTPPPKVFDPETASKYAKMYNDEALYRTENALHFPPSQRHYEDLKKAYTSPDGEKMLDAYFKKNRPGAPTIDEQYKVIKSLPPEEGLANLSKADMMMMKKDWQEIWTALQSRRPWVSTEYKIQNQ